MAKVEVSENLLLEVPHHFIDYMILKEITESCNEVAQDV
jgi:hypothetical protein